MDSCLRARKCALNQQKNVKTLYREAQAYIGLKNFVEGSSSLWECVVLEPKNNFFMTEFQKYVAIAKKKHNK